MDRKEKKEKKAKLSEYINFGNGRFKDHEIEELEDLVENRDNLNGSTRTYRSSYKAFDSEDTYHVEEKDTYTFHSDDTGIRIEKNLQKLWDDGQVDNFNEVYDSARDILENAMKIFGKRKK